ncbi:alkyl hydroperoxide reductase thiol specific antioxidant mal allergen [Colletotrichum kahawae]|uniref:Alkyl hydroperoxide reductase thiol specific antioxidant mal allergen n=1 Tax=Colletotrichum kahawae TaxID=34407 RepID=A0AAE0D4Q7_COLKA|nr:alkyl hydroperoxide reductase thiol specific antioxidant mal allergen [Colletotrichum kahawae]
MWKCNEEAVDERGVGRDHGLYENHSWLSCLELYSGKKLTIQSDRITALLGIVAALQEDRGDSFRTEFGVWEDDLAEQLLWRHSEAPCNDFPNLPSWCWAATGGSKNWATTNIHPELLSTVVVNQNSHTVTLTQSGSLNASGLLIRVRASSLCFQDCCLAEFWHDYSPEGRLIPGYSGAEDRAGRFPIYHVGGTRSVLGLGIFDSSVHPSECFCFALTFENREEDRSYVSFYFYDISEYGGSESGEELPTRAGNLESSEGSEGSEGSECDDSDVQSTNGRNSAYLQEDEHVCLDLTKVKTYSGAYWSLLLQPVDDTLTKFRRIGIAIIWSRGLKEIEHEVQAFEIV